MLKRRIFLTSDPDLLCKKEKWIKTDPITERMKDQEQLKALNQLLSLVIGGRIANKLSI